MSLVLTTSYCVPTTYLEESMLTKPSRKNNIQVLRGIAILLVVAFHVRESLFPSGYVGVEIFFIISGYVLAPSLLEIARADQLKDARRLFVVFVRRRANRLLPAFYFSIILTTPLLVIFSSIADHKRISAQGLFSVLSIGNIGANLFAGNYFNPNPNPFIHLWSLSAEEQIYLITSICALLLAICRFHLLKKTRNLLITGLTVTMTLIALGMLLSADNRVLVIITNYYSPFSKIGFFFLGLYLNKLSSKEIHFLAKSKGVFYSIRIFVAILLIILLLPLKKDSGFELILSVAFASCFILLPKKEFFGDRSLRVLHWFGNRSYSIYLFHMPFIYLAKYSPLSGVSFEIRFTVLAIALLLSFILGDFSYRFIENVSISSSNHAYLSRFNIGKLKGFLTSIVLLLVMLLGSSQNYGLKISSISNEFFDVKQDNCPVELEYGLCFNDFQKSRKSILLLGDSHARHFLTPILTIASRKNLNVVHLPQGMLNSGGWNSLSSRNREILLDTAQTSGAKYLIISELFTSKLKPVEMKDFLGPFKDRFQLTLIIGQSPMFQDRNALMHYFQPALISKWFIEVPTAEVSVSEIDQVIRASGKDLEALATSNQLFFLDTLSVLCPKNLCVRRINEQWLYSDNHHLTSAGANLLLSSIEEVLRFS